MPVKTDSTARKIVIEQNKCFSESALWRLQREYFDQEGINAWVNQVPFYITSNPFIAQCYAEIALSFIRDWLTQHPESQQHPFYLMELGTGSGRFSYYMVKTLRDLLDKLGMTDIKFCYVMSDFTKNNIKYWETHPALKPYVESGMIDFAMYDMETERPLTLVNSNIKLGPDVLVNPLMVCANYIFDTISHDSFAVHEGKLYELLLTLSTPESNMQNNRPVDMEQISVDYTVKEVRGNYYNDSTLDNLLDTYRKELLETSFLFPIGSFRAIKYLKKLANDKLLIMSTDKGYSTLESLDHLGHPSISFHGSFSMMVNFHAIAEYFKNTGGDALLPTPRRGIKTLVFLSGMTLKDMPRTALTVEQRVEQFSPSDYFTLHRRMSDSFHECNLETIASHMELTGWDPHIYLKLSSRVTSLIDETDAETLEFMATNMPRLAANYYYMPKSECILFEIGVFFHALKNYSKALEYYKQAQSYIGEQFGLFYNMALCEFHVEKLEDSLAHFKTAKTLDPDSKETEEWITYVEKAMAEKDQPPVAE